jgi:hypothetical protein
MQHAAHPPGNVGTEAMGTMYSLADVNRSKKERTVREVIPKLKSTADADVGVGSTLRARLRIHVWGVAAIPGAATSMTLVIPSRIFLIAQSFV